MKEIESISVTDAGKRYRIPFYSIQGKAPGKTLLLIAGQHGGEWNGIEVIRRVFQEINPSLLTGRVLAVPVDMLRRSLGHPPPIEATPIVFLISSP
jgi:predicted deacylase